MLIHIGLTGLIGGTIWCRTVSLSAASDSPHHSWTVRVRLSTGFPFLPNLVCAEGLRTLSVSGPAITLLLLLLLLSCPFSSGTDVGGERER